MFIRKTNKCVIHSRQLDNGLRQINVLAQDKLLVPLDKTTGLRGGHSLLGQQGRKEVGGLHKVGLVLAEEEMVGCCVRFVISVEKCAYLLDFSVCLASMFFSAGHVSSYRWMVSL